MSPSPTSSAPADVVAYYRATMLGLRLLEGREGRGQRFGDAAHARWRSFAGSLGERDRLELLLRAASVTAPLAFAPRSVFALEGLTDDEPFGPRWPGPPRGLAAELLQAASRPLDTSAPRESLDQVLSLWGHPCFAVSPALTTQLERLSPATKVVVAGAQAIVTLALAAQGRTDLDLATQAILVSERPSERQLWGIALVVLQSRSRGRTLAPAEASSTRVRAAGFARLDLALVSEDATAPAAAAARELAQAMGS